MRLVNNTPNWLQLYDSDKIPPVEKWDLDTLERVLGDVIFHMHGCGKYSICYRAEVTLRHDSGPEKEEHRSQNDYIVDVECPRDGEHLRYAGNGVFLSDLPVEGFTIYTLEVKVSSGYLG